MNLIPQTLTARTLRDLANGLQQQMFFWGQDILHPEGNIFLENGFERSPSPGLRGTSCYHRKWKEGRLELYGSTSGWYGKDGGFAFIRPQKKCVVWNSSAETPIPGIWQDDCILRDASRNDLYQASLPFLDWLLSYEDTVLAEFGKDYRTTTYERYKKVPKAKAWLEPQAALTWFQGLRHTPENLLPAKRVSKPRSFIPA